MGLVISDGLGKGLDAGIDLRNRLLTASITETESNYATSVGLKFNINTGDISFSTDDPTTVLYLKNNDSRDIVVDTLIYNIGSNTGGSGDRLINVIKNPTQGDIITNNNNADVGVGAEANFNFGSAISLNADVLKGAQGETLIADGTPLILTRNSSTQGTIAINPGGGMILQRGNSLAIDYYPPTGTTAQIAQFALNVYVLQA